jgi:hypothetical protein
MTKVSVNQRRSLNTSPFSAANTPHWQVKLDATRMIVNGVAYARSGTIFSPSGRVIGQLPGCTARAVKYMANSPAKNMSSLDSHTIVPTLTMFGRVSE